jgi:hypothetical protein
MEASIGQLKKDKQSSLAELKKLQADMISAVQRIKVISCNYYFTSLILNYRNNMQ